MSFFWSVEAVLSLNNLDASEETWALHVSVILYNLESLNCLFYTKSLFSGRSFSLQSITNLDLNLFVSFLSSFNADFYNFFSAYLWQTVMFCHSEGTNYNCGHIVTAKIRQIVCWCMKKRLLMVTQWNGGSVSLLQSHTIVVFSCRFPQT